VWAAAGGGGRAGQGHARHAPVTVPAATTAAGVHRLDLGAIRSALGDLSDGFAAINAQLDDPHEPLSGVVIDNLMGGYELIDQALAGRIDLLAFGQSGQLLELNARVLCGRDPAERQRLAVHLNATEQHFYDDSQGGVRDLVEWYDGHRRLSVWRRAAGAYVRAISAPQLWIEGNHRAGSLLMSWILAREGRPPVVPTRATAGPRRGGPSELQHPSKGRL